MIVERGELPAQVDRKWVRLLGDVGWSWRAGLSRRARAGGWSDVLVAVDEQGVLVAVADAYREWLRGAWIGVPRDDEMSVPAARGE